MGGVSGFGALALNAWFSLKLIPTWQVSCCAIAYSQ